MFQIFFVILNIYVWFNPVGTYNVDDFFDPCSKEMVAKYSISERRILDLYIDCGSVDGRRGNSLVSKKAVITEEEKEELIEKVNKYYEEK